MIRNGHPTIAALVMTALAALAASPALDAPSAPGASPESLGGDAPPSVHATAATTATFDGILATGVEATSFSMTGTIGSRHETYLNPGAPAVLVLEWDDGAAPHGLGVTVRARWDGAEATANGASPLRVPLDGLAGIVDIGVHAPRPIGVAAAVPYRGTIVTSLT